MSHDELSLRSNDVVRCGVISLGQVDCMYSKHSSSGVPCCLRHRGIECRVALFLENMSSKSNGRRWLCLIANYVQRGGAGVRS